MSDKFVAFRVPAVNDDTDDPLELTVAVDFRVTDGVYFGLARPPIVDELPGDPLIGYKVSYEDAQDLAEFLVNNITRSMHG